MREVNKATIERLPLGNITFIFYYGRNSLGHSVNQVLAKIWCKTIPYFLKLLSQFGDCTSRMLS
ncbi:unnamed protein product [Acanthoscelides obtectus]|uniref:Uncharacterized protein n=1 Tax=Acanthoscelides obtectus TaxID=200917 RepID=A0A9P0LEU6_ACAOB|nr:unnamed protein product [Acanthoscelides obtectus]CAK1635501.1 hypothetical protein AOBTE_LOCUS9319 [Acanthoscelides obtectus]